jgi:glycosyltransferase involved in cell wall biosynthesis
MNYHPKVSIIIPVYNGSNYLSESINCALTQTYSNIEVIVVNDGSCDNGASEQIAQRYGDKIRYFAKQNGGVSSALNLGISKATGEWISWLSHDDLYYPNKIEKQVVFLNDLLKKDPSTDLNKTVVFCDGELIDANGRLLFRYDQRQNHTEDNLELMLRNIMHNYLGGNTFLLPIECFKDIGSFNEELRTVQDFDFWYRLLFAKYRFCNVKEILVKGRIHGAQVTFTQAAKGRQEMKGFYQRFLKDLSSHKDFSSFDALKRSGCYIAAKGFFAEALVSLNYARNINFIASLIYYPLIILYYFYGKIRRSLKPFYISLTRK